MSKTLGVSTSVTLSGDNFGGSQPFFTETLTNTAATTPQLTNLALGFNSIPIPAAALGVLIVPPPGNVNTLTLKGVTGDTGIPINPAASTRLNWTAAQVANLGITASAATVITLIWL